MPYISVLLPVYNGEKYLKEAIDSVLNQSFGDFELLLLNDGSIDGSEDIIKSYSDKRIRYIKNEGNQGLIYTLNRGIDLAEGAYIARMDADDIAMPDRFKHQVCFLDRHPEIGFCGTWAYRIDAGGNTTGRIRKPVDGEMLRICTLFTPSYIHPSVMIRTHLLKANKYDSNFKHAEDYELWVRLQKKVMGANLSQYLLKYRWHGENISVSQNAPQVILRKQIIESQLNDWGIAPTKEDMANHLSTFQYFGELNLCELKKWFIRLKYFNRDTSHFATHKFNAFLLSRWIIACVHTHNYLEMCRFIFPFFKTLKYLLTILYQKK